MTTSKKMRTFLKKLRLLKCNTLIDEFHKKKINRANPILVRIPLLQVLCINLLLNAAEFEMQLHLKDSLKKEMKLP